MLYNRMANKIMMLSDSILGSTGFGTVTRDLGIRLDKQSDMNVVNVSWNYHGQDLESVRFKEGFNIDFPILSGSKQKYAADLIESYLREHKPDVFYVLLDSFMLMQTGYMNKDFAPAKSIMYFPSDGAFFPKQCEKILNKFDHTVAMANHGMRQLKWLYKNNYINLPVHKKMTHIPHAVDETHYYPYTPEKKAKARASFNIPQNAFVIGVVARNQGRKFLDRTMKAFSEVVWGDDDNKPINDAYLFMHSDPGDNAAPTDLVDLTRRYKVEHRVIWSGMDFLRGVSMERMKDVFNVMDIHFLSTSGEGFGVPTVESMACGVPSVITDFTSSAELIHEHGQVGETVKLLGMPRIKYNSKTDFDNYAEVYAPTHELNKQGLTGSWNVERGLCDIKDAAAKIRKLYYDRKLLGKYAIAGREKVLKHYSWNNVVGPKWVNFVRKVANS